MHAAVMRPSDALVMVLLAIALVLGMTQTTPTLSLQIVLGCLVILVAFTSVSASLYLLIFSMLLSPEIAIGRMQGQGVGGREISIRGDDVLLIVIGLSWLVKTAVYRDLALFRETSLNRPIFYYMLVCVMATLLGVLSGRVRPTTGFFFVMKYFEYFFVFFMVVNHVTTKQQVVRLVIALFITCLIISFYAISQIPSGQRATAPFEGEAGEPNTLGGYLVFMMAILTGFWLHVKEMPIRTGLAIFLGLITLALLATLSRSSYLAAAALLCAVVATQWRRPRVLVLVMVVMMLIPLLAPSNVKQRVSDTFFGRQYGTEVKIGAVALDSSTSERLRSWAYVVNDWVYHPLLGRGVTGYAWADAQYVKILGETGLAGLVTFSILIGRLWKRARKAFLSEQDPFCKGLAHGFLLGMVAMLVHAVGANTFILIRIMEPFWLCAGLVMLLPTLEDKQPGDLPVPSAPFIPALVR